MKKITYLLIIVSIILTSCSTVEFENSVPKEGEAFSSFPIELIGVYIDAQDQDTLTIMHTSFTYTMDFGTSTSDSKKIYELSDKGIILKKFGDYYILNLKSEDNNNWTVLPIKLSLDSLEIYYLLLDGNIKDKEQAAKYTKDKLEILNAITELTLIPDTLNRIDNYLISPTDKQFIEILEKEMFNKVFTFKRLTY